uniref:Cytochrome c biogenesis protein CcsB n=1 Tax=Hildenbrandia rivularis TaxID=135206 RepID=A0A1C9CFN3_9FLOR|nr:c-type cytochrome biogenensis protein [Hildenbrandia rivularis]AOM67208.1 c-type cytochrome biogenensis protein [Hildenbrandia rivularis]
MNSLPLDKTMKTSIWHSIKKLGNLTFAINTLFCIAGFSTIGTIIEQNQNLKFYKDTYPDYRKLLWIIDWKFIKYLQLDHIYTTWWFTTLIILFSSSLIVCTLSTQLPMLKSAKKWKFYFRQQQIAHLQNATSVKSLPFPAFTLILNNNNYYVFQQNNKIYAYKGLLGRIAPIFVHLSIILLLLGSLLSFFGGLIVQEMITVGETIHPQNIIKSGNFGYLQQKFMLRVNNFIVKYNLDNSIQQFLSDLSVLDFNGNQQVKKLVQVNTPLYFQNMTIYQTDWDIVAIRLRLQNNKHIQIPCQPLKQENNKTWISTIRLSPQNTISIIVADLTGKLYIYNQQGYLINITKTHTLLKFECTDIYIESIIARTGLQIKTDPGIWLVYFSFATLIISSTISYTSYSQLWAIYSHNELYFGGKTNRAYLDFEDDLTKITRYYSTTIFNKENNLLKQ